MTEGSSCGCEGVTNNSLSNTTRVLVIVLVSVQVEVCDAAEDGRWQAYSSGIPSRNTFPRSEVEHTEVQDHVIEPRVQPRVLPITIASFFLPSPSISSLSLFLPPCLPSHLSARWRSGCKYPFRWSSLSFSKTFPTLGGAPRAAAVTRLVNTLSWGLLRRVIALQGFPGS